MNCKMCNAEFEPCKKDERIVFCSRACRLKFRNIDGYMQKYYSEKKSKWQKRQRSREFKDKKNTNRKNRYANDAEFREKKKAEVREYNARKPHIKQAQRLSMYGLTINDHSDLVKKQDGKCAICGLQPSNENKYNQFYIDHNHTTGKIRGLLCNKCNFAIGHFNDSIDILKNAIKYLEENDG